MQVNKTYNRMVGGAAPHHWLEIPDDDEDGCKLRDLLDQFTGDKPVNKWLLR